MQAAGAASEIAVSEMQELRDQIPSHYAHEKYQWTSNRACTPKRDREHY